MCIRDSRYSFEGKWTNIEVAFFAALGNEQVITRLSKFFKAHTHDFCGKTMEQIIIDTESVVDKLCWAQQFWPHVWKYFGGYVLILSQKIFLQEIVILGFLSEF